MPIYIVSWTDGECMLMRCRNEDDLIYRLDQFDNPAEATWKVYKDPFIISLRPEIERSEEQPFITYSAELTGDEEVELGNALTKFAFPMTYRAQEEAWDKGEDIGLELLLQAEIASKGAGAESEEKLQDWIRRTFASQLEHLPEEERERRLDQVSKMMGWK